MSQKLEEVFRSALKDQEVPFDPKAWESMSARLDEVMPVKPKGGSNSLWIAASVAAAVGLATLGYLSSGDDTTQQAKSNDQVVTEKSSTLKEEKVEVVSSNNIAENDEPKEVQTVAKVEENTITNTPKKPVAEEPQVGKPEENSMPPVEKKIERPEKPGNTTVDRYVPIENYPISGAVCQFDTEVISNPFKLPLTFTAPSGKKQTIEAEGKRKIKFDETGVYTLNVGDKRPQTLTVNHKPVFDFEAVKQYYDDGVPTYELSATGEIENPVWRIKETNITYKGQNVEIHLFNKGYTEIELTSDNASGCAATVAKRVNVTEDYNLRPSNALYPNDPNSDARTFLPTALKLRDTPFTMVIIDPRNGDIVFSTNDPNNPWDGRNKSTGEMVDMDVVNYRWSVTLEKPLKGEKSKYSGTVVVSSQRQ